MKVSALEMLEDKLVDSNANSKLNKDMNRTANNISSISKND